MPARWSGCAKRAAASLHANKKAMNPSKHDLNGRSKSTSKRRMETQAIEAKARSNFSSEQTLEGRSKRVNNSLSLRAERSNPQPIIQCDGDCRVALALPNTKPSRCKLSRHSRAIGNPGRRRVTSKGWVPAYAGMSKVPLMRGDTTSVSSRAGRPLPAAANSQ